MILKMEIIIVPRELSIHVLDDYMWIGATGNPNPVWMDGTKTQDGFSIWTNYPGAPTSKYRGSMRSLHAYKWIMLLNGYSKPYICEAFDSLV